MMNYKLFIMLFVGILFIPNTLATFSGNDDAFHTTGTLSAVDNLCTVVVDVTFHDFGSTGAGGAIGSFDDPDDINTDRTPLRARVVRDVPATCLGTGNSIRIRIYQTQSCSGGTIIDQTYTTSGTANINQNTGWDGFLGSHCVRLDATADDSVLGTVSTNDQTGRIGTAPYLDSWSVNPYKNMFFNQIVTWNMEAAENSDIQNIIYRLSNASNGATLGFGGSASQTDTSPLNTDSRQMINFPTNPTFVNNNASVQHRALTWTDESTAHSRFSTNSTGSTSTGLTPSINWTMTNTTSCSNFFNKDGIKVYNRGRTPDNSGVIRNATSGVFDITSGVQFDLFYVLTGQNTAQFSDTGWNIDGSGSDAGSWNRSGTTIPSTASAGFSTGGSGYDMRFRARGVSDSTEFAECRYTLPMNVSNLLLTSTSPTTITNTSQASIPLANRGMSESIINTRVLYVNGNPYGSSGGSHFVLQWRDSNSDILEQSDTVVSTNSTSFLTGGTITTTSSGRVNSVGNNDRGKYWRIIQKDGNFVSNNNGARNGTTNVANLTQTLYISNNSATITNTTVVDISPKIYNRGEQVNLSAFVYHARGTSLGSTSNNIISFHNSTRFQINSATISTNSSGGLSRSFTIASTVQADDDFIGEPYFAHLRTNNNNTVSTLNHPNYGQANGTGVGDTFNISKKYNVSVEFDKAKYQLTEFFEITTTVLKARGSPVNNAKFNLSVYDKVPNLRYSTNATTDSSGTELINTFSAIRPTGSWSGNSTVYPADNFQNNGEASQEVIVVSPGQDPLFADADGAYIVGETNNWIAIKAITPSGDRVFNDEPCTVGETCIRDGDMNITVYFPNGTEMLEDTTTFYNPSDWRYNLTLPQSSPIGTYTLYVSAEAFEGSASGDSTAGIWSANAVFQVWGCRPGDSTCIENITSGGGGAGNPLSIDDLECSQRSENQEQVYCGFTFLNTDGTYNNTYEFDYVIRNSTNDDVDSGSAINTNTFGLYRFNWTADNDDTYHIISYNSTYSIAKTTTVQVIVRGGLNDNQNSTLYQIVDDILAHRLNDTAEHRLTRENNTVEHNITNDKIDSVIINSSVTKTDIDNAVNDITGFFTAIQMADAMEVTAWLTMLIAIGLMIFGWRKKEELPQIQILWYSIATVIFLGNILFSMSLPFETNDAGETVGNAGNIILAVLNLLGALIGVALIYDKFQDLLAVKRKNNPKPIH